VPSFEHGPNVSHDLLYGSAKRPRNLDLLPAVRTRVKESACRDGTARHFFKTDGLRGELNASGTVMPLASMLVFNGIWRLAMKLDDISPSHET